MFFPFLREEKKSQACIISLGIPTRGHSSHTHTHTLLCTEPLPAIHCKKRNLSKSGHSKITMHRHLFTTVDSSGQISISLKVQVCLCLALFLPVGGCDARRCVDIQRHVTCCITNHVRGKEKKIDSASCHNTHLRMHRNVHACRSFRGKWCPLAPPQSMELVLPLFRQIRSGPINTNH